MGFSLKKLVNDINPFDGPKQQTAVASPPPASTARPQINPIQVRGVVRPTFMPTASTASPVIKPLSVGVTAPQPLNVGSATIQPNTTMRTQTPARENFLSQQLHPSLGRQIKTELASKLVAPLATADAVKNLGQQFITRPAAEAISSLAPKQVTYHPGSRVEKAIFGSTPVQNIEKNVVNTYDSHPNLPGPVRVGLAGLDVPAQVINSIPLIDGVAKGGAKLADAAVDAAPKVTTKLVDKLGPILADQADSAGKDIRRSQKSGLALSKPSVTTKLVPANLEKVGTSGLAKPNPVATQLLDHFHANYTPASDSMAEANAADYFHNNMPQALQDYQARTNKIFGSDNIVAGDDAKYSVPGMSPANSVPFHESASTFAKGYYDHLLADPATTDKPVLITAGGTGAGKTSALKTIFNGGGASAKDYSAIIDTNSTTLKAADSRIAPALASGRPVSIKYVYRDPLEAFQNGVIPRAAKEGRIIPASTHAETHAGSLDAIKQLAEKYKNNPNVNVSIVDNSRGAGNATEVPLDFLKDKSYSKSELEAKIHELLDTQLEEGKLNHEQHQQFKGQETQTAGTSKSDSLGQTGTDVQTVGQGSNSSVRQKFESERQSGQLTPPGDRPIIGTDLGNRKVVQNRLTKGGKAGRQNLSEAAQAEISGEHAVRSTQQLANSAESTADSRSLDKTIAAAHKALAVPVGQIDDKTVALAQQAIERADAAGRLEDAVGIHDALSEHLVKNGQTIQAASLLYRLSPRGLLYKALKDLKKSGNEASPELKQQLSDLADKIKDAPDDAAKQRATGEFHKLVSDNIPKSKLDNALAVWKAGLLSGAKTQDGNLASNATFGALKKISDIPATFTDQALALVTGKRSKTLALKGIASGTKQGITTGIDTMRTGIDSRNAGGNKYESFGELNFKNPVIQKVFGTPSNLVFRGMNAADQPFYYAALKNNLADLAKADGINQGLSGSDLKNYVVKTMAAPTEQMAEAAKLAAQKSVLGQDSKLATAVTEFTKKVPVAQVLAPFVKVPTNFLTRTLDFTPVGAIKTVVQQIKAGKFDQRALSEAVGEATTGSALLYLGAELANHNLLSGQYPTNDPKEAARWKAEGITPNSLKIGNKWISLNYLGPVGLLFGAGQDYHDAAATGNDATLAALTGFGKNLTGQSFLTGFSGFADALNDPTRSAKTFLNSEASSVVPTWANDLANITDKYQRQTNTVGQAVESRLPGLRNTLPVKEDVYGNKLTQRTSPLNLLANPLKPSDINSNPVMAEVSRLHFVDPNNKDLQVTPTPINKTIQVSGKPVKFSTTQSYNLQQAVGQAIQTKWGELINTPQYKALSDTDKANALNNLRQGITEATERQFVLDNNLGTYNKAASSAAVRATTGDVASFAVPKGSGATGTAAENALSDDAEYKGLLAKYNDNVKNNKFATVASKIKAQADLAKAKAGSTFSSNTRDLYTLSNDQLYNYVSTDPNGKAIAAQVIAYGDALVNAGIETKNKFRNKAGAITLAAPTDTASSSGSASTKSFASQLAAITSADTKNEKAVLDLVKNSKLTKSKVKTLAVKKVALKKQSVKALKKVKVA